MLNLLPPPLPPFPQIVSPDVQSRLLHTAIEGTHDLVSAQARI